MIILLLLGYKENLKAALLHASPVSLTIVLTI